MSCSGGTPGRPIPEYITANSSSSSQAPRRRPCGSAGSDDRVGSDPPCSTSLTLPTAVPALPRIATSPCRRSQRCCRTRGLRARRWRHPPVRARATWARRAFSRRRRNSSRETRHLHRLLQHPVRDWAQAVSLVAVRMRRASRRPFPRLGGAFARSAGASTSTSAGLGGRAGVWDRGFPSSVER